MLLASLPTCRIFFLSPKRGEGGTSQPRLVYKGGWLLTHPDEDFARMALKDEDNSVSVSVSESQQPLLVRRKPKSKFRAGGGGVAGGAGQ